MIARLEAIAVDEAIEQERVEKTRLQAVCGCETCPALRNCGLTIKQLHECEGLLPVLRCGSDCNKCGEDLCESLPSDPCGGECRGCEEDGCQYHRPGVLRN
jgi:hypothetical protein